MRNVSLTCPLCLKRDIVLVVASSSSSSRISMEQRKCSPEKLRGLSFVAHEFMGDERAFIAALQLTCAYLPSAGDRVHVTEFVVEFVQAGKPLSRQAWEELREFFVNHEWGERVVRAIERQMDSHAPVLGSWRTASPREDLLAWTQWGSAEMCDMLTLMCLPFYWLRAWEFQEGAAGPNLRSLNQKGSSLANFVASTVLAGCCVSRDRGQEVTEKWLKIGDGLLERQNYHMAFAIQNGLAKHQIDRLAWLWKAIGRKSAKSKKALDAFFDVNSRMQQYTDAVRENAGKQPMIPCIFWLMQKGLLLKECPLMEGGRINEQHVAAAANIFADALVKAQSVALPKIKEVEHVLFYFQRLERGSCADFFTEEVWDALSDHVKNPPKGVNSELIKVDKVPMLPMSSIQSLAVRLSPALKKT